MLSYIYFGTPEISATCLQSLIELYGKPCLVITNEDKPSGRKMLLTKTPVKILAEENNILCLTPNKLKEVKNDLELYVKNNAIDIGILFAYGKIIPEWLLHLFPCGIINVHPSLLPLYRGASPIESPLLFGDNETGITIMDMDKDLDTGDIYLQEKVPMHVNTTRKDLENIITVRAPEMLKTVLHAIENGTAQKTNQDNTRATYTKKHTKADGDITNEKDELTKWNKYRAYIGWPGVYFFRDIAGITKRIKITHAEYVNNMFVIKKVIPEGGNEIDFTNLNL